MAATACVSHTGPAMSTLVHPSRGRMIMSKMHSFPILRSVMAPSAAAGAAIAVALAVLGSLALAQQDRYTLTVPGGLAFAEFRGYEDWPVISISDNSGKFAAILGNPV